MNNIVKEAQLHYMANGFDFRYSSLRDLLYIVIGPQRNPMDTRKIVETIMQLHEKIGFKEISYHDLISINGVGEALATRILAAVELGVRLTRNIEQEVKIIRSPEDVYHHFRFLDKLNQEHFVVLFLNTKNHLIGKKTIFVGSLNASVVHPREVFKEAMRFSASSIIVGHNHPSGDPDASQEDIHVTKRLVEAGKILGIGVLDHVIVGKNRFNSLKEKGYM